MKTLRKIVCCIFLVFLEIIYYQSDSSSIAMVEAATGVSISQDLALVLPGETLQLSISGTTQKVTWSSSDKSIASVNQSGLVTAKECGAVYITAKVNKKTYQCLFGVVDLSEIEILSDVDVMTTNGAPILVYASSFTYDEVMADMDIEYQLVGTPNAKIEDVNNPNCNVYSYADGYFEVTASFHGKVIDTIKLHSIQFPGFDKDQVSLKAGEADSVYVSLPYYYPDLGDITITSSDSSVAVTKAINHSNFYGSFLGHFCVKGLKSGTATISVKICDTTKTFQVTVTGENQQPLYNPVQAVKLGKFNGYTGTELKSLLYVYDFIHDYHLDSDTMTDKEKIDYFQILFYYLYYFQYDYTYNWTCYGDISQLLLQCDGLGLSTSCAETICFLCDCLDLPNYYCTGTYDGKNRAWNQINVDGTWIYLDAEGYLEFKRDDIASTTLWDGYILKDKIIYSDSATSGKDYLTLIW